MFPTAVTAYGPFICSCRCRLPPRPIDVAHAYCRIHIIALLVSYFARVTILGGSYHERGSKKLPRPSFAAAVMQNVDKKDPPAECSGEKSARVAVGCCLLLSHDCVNRCSLPAGTVELQPEGRDWLARWQPNTKHSMGFHAGETSKGSQATCASSAIISQGVRDKPAFCPTRSFGLDHLCSAPFTRLPSRYIVSSLRLVVATALERGRPKRADVYQGKISLNLHRVTWYSENRRADHVSGETSLGPAVFYSQLRAHASVDYCCLVVECTIHT